jgi:pimeloyl-ACP methyl ester carboxylesterase
MQEIYRGFIRQILMRLPPFLGRRPGGTFPKREIRTMNQDRNRRRCSFRWTPALWAIQLVLLCVPADADIQFRSIGSNDKLILLVHGLWGDPMASFGSWPLIMVNDRTVLNAQSLSQFSMAALGYPASRHDRLTPRQAAQNLLEELKIEFKRRDYKEVYFVSHSLGGIITKQILVDALGRMPQIAQRTRAIFLVGVPSADARLETMLTRLPLGKAMAGPMIKYLLTEEGAQYLRNLDETWSDVLAGRNSRMHIAQHCAYETRPVGVRPFSAVVVPQQQAESACTSKFIANNENHVSIVKPNTGSPIHVWVRDRILAASGPAPMMPWEPVFRPECRPYKQGMRFRVGGYGLFKQLSFTAVVEQDACGPNILATIIGRGNPIIVGGHNSDSCTEYRHYNSLAAGMQINMPRSCINDTVQ